MIDIGNCTECGYFPTQFIKTTAGVMRLHLPKNIKDDCATESAREAINGLEARLAKVRELRDERRAMLSDPDVPREAKIHARWLAEELTAILENAQ